ncbi:venom C-type lectin mannose binding isoform 2 [Aphelenchoides avenae]|nr:venom C-type lectin mannose binding isoform 2 [Aphelenchus avenae]
MGSFFIGLVRNDIHDTWDWVDLSDYEYSNWSPGEPNNTGNDENCVVEWTLDFSNRPSNLWNDVQCHAVRDAVCETNIEPVCADEKCIVSTIRDVITAVDSYEV